MGFLGAMFNGAQGSGFQAQGPNAQQVNAAGQPVQQGIQQQQAFLNALAGQNGIGNQSSVYNQLQGVANGTGPNPAQAMLNNTTGQNIAQQAALQGSQRGVGQNAGMLARQVAQQGGQLQQQAAGQGAALQANQSLNALNQLGGLATQQVGQQQGAIGGLNAAAQGNQGQLLGNLASQNAANAGIAQGNQQFQQSAANGVGNAVGQGVGLLLSKGGAVPSSIAGQYFRGTPMKDGGHVKGTAKVAGDSPKNDTVPAMLSPGEIVVPRSKAHDPKKAAAFAAAVAAKKGKK